MNKGFWEKLSKPFFVLAPMADVTDCAFRKVIAKYGKPDVFWTEFVSADGLAHDEAREKLLIDLKYGEDEHPIVGQIFGANTENIEKASKLLRELGFDGVDINMGCPDKSIEKQGAGACMIKNIDVAKAVIESARAGAGELPVSVKTRLGYNKVEIDTWIRGLLEMHLPVLTVHLRTRKEMSNVPAHWELMQEIIKLRDEVSPETLIIGNGDATDIDDARKKCLETGADGVMLGRAIFGNPFLFTNKNVFSQRLSISVLEKLRVLVEHTKLFEEMLMHPPAGGKNFAIMKKHYKAYVNGFAGAKELRVKLMDAVDAKEVESIVKDFCRSRDERV